MSAEIVTRADRDAFVASVHRRTVRTVTRSLAEGWLVFGLGFWVVYGIVVVTVPLIVHASGGVMGGGVMAGAPYSARWFAFSLAMIVFMIIVPAHLGAGGTRRALFDGVLRATLATSVLYAVVDLAGLAGERALFHALGWEWTNPDASPLGGWGLLLTVAAQALVVATYILVGVGLVVGFQTYGLWRATLRIVPGLLLLGVAEAAAGSGTGSNIVADGLRLLGTGPTAGGLAAGVVVLVLTALWLRHPLLSLHVRMAR